MMKFRAELQLDGKTTTGITVPPAVLDGLGGGKRPPVRVTRAHLPQYDRASRQAIVLQDKGIYPRRPATLPSGSRPSRTSSATGAATRSLRIT